MYNNCVRPWLLNKICSRTSLLTLIKKSGFATFYSGSYTRSRIFSNMRKNPNVLWNRCDLSFQAPKSFPLIDLTNELVLSFKSNEIPDPEYSAKLIVEFALRKGGYENFDYDMDKKIDLSEDQVKVIRNLCECRLARMPLQYIVREWDFRELCLAMIPPVFIPRPETEQLVDLVLKNVSAELTVDILEVGCGSGAICLSLLKALPNAQVVAIDQSKMACHLTKKNSQLNGLEANLKIVHCKLLEDGSLSQTLPLRKEQVDMLVSNPPYVPSSLIFDLQPEIKLYEDLRALEAGKDGLRVIKSLLLLSQTILRPGGQVFLEVDSSHPPMILRWITDQHQLNLRHVQTVKDYCDRDRFVHLEKLELNTS